MKKILATILICFITLSFGFNVFATSSGWNMEEACKLNPDAAMCQSNPDAPKFVGNIFNIIIGILGIVAVVGIIVGGYQFVTSRGDPGQTVKARNILVFSVVGLIVALLSFAIVNFVINNF